MSSGRMSGLQLQKYLERNSIKHPTALLHFERQLSDFEQGVLFLCVHIVARTEQSADGFYYLNKSLVRAVMRQEGNQDYARISDAVDRVSDTKLKLNFLGEDRTFDSYKAPLIIGQAGHKKRGVIAFEVHPRIEEAIKNPSVFSRLNIYFIAALSDVKRGHSFYALMKDHIDRTKTEEVVFDYWELRKYLGVDESAYPAFKEFKKYVLKPLIEAVNEHTDLQVAYVPVKTGRTLTHLKFTIKRQSWQLQLFEQEHVERMIEELAKTFDGPVIEGTATEAIEAPQDEVTRGLIKRAGGHGVSADTVNRAIAKFGELAVGEIIDHAERQFKKKTAKGEEYRAGDYLASLLNNGRGQKTPDQRRKAVEALEKKAVREAERAAKKAAEKAEKEFQARWKDHKQRRFEELTSSLTDLEIAELGEVVLGKLPNIASVRNRWRELGKDYRKLGPRKMNDKTIWAIVAGEVLTRWGTPEDNDLEAFRALELEAA